MGENTVRPIPRKIQYKGLKKSYPRISRTNTDLSPDFIAPEIRDCYPPATETECHVAAPAKPIPKSILIAEFDTADLALHNTLLAYRMLKLLYGPPDVLAARCRIEGESKILSPFGLEWGYLLKLNDHILAEVRSVIGNARLVIRFWVVDHEQDDEVRKTLAAKAPQFLQDYQESLQKNAHLFSEEMEIPKDRVSAAPGVMNVFAQNYRAAEELLEFAEEQEPPNTERYLAWQESLGINTYGYLYVSAAIQFFSALEALINTILTLKLKDEFRADQYDRITVRADLDVRLMTAHLFCHGIATQIVTPKTELWKRLLKLRDFRNAIVHGNITSEHYLYTLFEDSNMFYYGPSFDFRGRRLEAASTERYPTTMSAIRLETVNDIKTTVDLVVAAILDAADPETADWLKGWIWKPFISPDVAKFFEKLATHQTVTV
jgi:hypothetical protein